MWYLELTQSSRDIRTRNPRPSKEAEEEIKKESPGQTKMEYFGLDALSYVITFEVLERQ